MSWGIMRNVSSVTAVRTRTIPGRLWGTRTVLDYETVPGGPFDNDIVVTVNSANPSYASVIRQAFGGNHATVKNPDLIQLVVDRTIPIKQ